MPDTGNVGTRGGLRYRRGMSVAQPWSGLPEPPVEVTDEADQDRRLVRQMLLMTPSQRLETLRNWARMTSAAAREAVDPTPVE